MILPAVLGLALASLTFDGGEELPSDAGVEPTPVLDAGVELVSADSAPPDVADAGVLPEAQPAPAQFDTLVVATRETQTAGSVHVITSRQLQRFELDDPHAVLRSAPGVYSRGEDGVGLRPNVGMRGVNPDRSKKITLMEDGVLLAPAPYAASAAYYFPLITRMVSVRVLKGPTAIIHGPHTVGGAVELVTRDIPGGESGGLDLALGEYGYGKLHGHFGFSGERTGVVVEGVHLRSSGFRLLDGGGDTGFRRNEWMVKVQHQPELPGGTHRFGLKLGYSDEVSNETYLGLTDEDARAAPSRRYLSSFMDRMAWVRTQLVASHRLTREDLVWSTQVYRQDFDRTWRKVNGFRGADIRDVLARPEGARNAIFYADLTGTGDASSVAETLLVGPNHRTFVSQGIQSSVRFTFPTGPVRHAVEAGARYHYDEVKRVHSQDGFLMTGGVLVPDGQPTEVTADNRASAYALALHAMDVVSLGPVTVSPGARVELIRTVFADALGDGTTVSTRAVLVPGIGVHWQALPALGAFVGVHRGFSPAAPGPTVSPPESSANFEAGVRFTPGRTRLEVIGFFNDYQNLTSICTLSSGCREERLDSQLDAGRAHVLGVELQGEHVLKGPWGLSFPLSATYTFTRSELLDPFSSEEWGEVAAGDELPYVPEHQLAAQGSLEAERWGVSVQVSYAGRMRELPGQGEEGLFTDAQLTLDATAKVKPFEWLEVYFNARNLLDARPIVARRPFGARTLAPRWLQAGVKLSF